jgi:16S rRNA (cytidine1402-2'-O)-methyltransferase
MPTNEEPVTGQYLHYATHPNQRAKISMIATPIGNLADMTTRALKLLLGDSEKLDELWCEDTRHTQNLLNALGVDKLRTRRVDQHITPAELKNLLEKVQNEGLRVGVVTDAGTPGVSDPGAKIVQLVASEFPNIKLETIPGASAVTALVAVSGFEENSFSFQGFFPRDAKEGDALLTQMKNSGITRNWIFFESPMRIKDTIVTLINWCKHSEITPKFILAKELTKMFETLWMGEGAPFLEHLVQQNFDERGEWLFALILPKDCVKKYAQEGDADGKAEADWPLSLECLILAGVTTKTASQIISQKYGVAKNLAYPLALELQKKIKNN